MAEKHDLTPGRRRFPRVLVAMVIAPLCLGLLLVAARQDTARSGMGDWETVQEYLALQRAWGEPARGISMAGLSDEERNRRFQDAFAERPDIRPAIAAANAIVDAGGVHDKTMEAAEDDAEGVAWYRRAAGQGYADAQFLLGFVYGNGEGVPLDYAESLASFRRAAEQRHDAAQWMLGAAYYWGHRGAPRNDVAAYMWLHLALSQNDKHDRSPLDQLQARMSPAQIAEAQRLAREWLTAR